ncbi:MAG: rhodanese-like domain-containing protein [Myxococcota bacterium]
MSLFKTILGWMTSGPDRISVDEGRKRVEAGATLVDVRSAAEFASGHLPHALNIPIGDLGERVSEIPKGGPVVLYCFSGARSRRGAAYLRAAGYDAGDMGPMPSRWR